MNEKEISELRRRLRPEKNGITHICGCYVNESKEIVARFDQPLLDMEEEESDKFLALLRRVLTGGLGKNLLEISFPTQQVASGEAHQRLMALRDTALKDTNVLDAFYRSLVDALQWEGNYAILLAHDSYDVPFRGKDGARLEDASETVFPHVLCAVCLVKLTKPALHYDADTGTFRRRRPDWVLGAPELGFLFPAFDSRATNLYGALYYTHSAAENHAELFAPLFGVEPPMPADAQKEAFCSMLSDTLAGECDLRLVRAVHAQLSDRIAEHKASRDPEPLTLSKREVRGVLEACGVPDEARGRFLAAYDAQFGADAALSPANLVDTGHFEVRTPDVVIRINPERSGLIETRTIGEETYIMIHAEGGVEVNGVNIHLEEPPAP